MNAETLITRINQYNAQKEEIFDKATDEFIAEADRMLEGEYAKGNWICFVSAKYLAIPIAKIESDFQSFVIDPFRSYTEKKELEDDECVPFFKYVEEQGEKSIELCGLDSPSEILLLKAFCETLEKKGFMCYVDEDLYQTVVVLEIK